MCVCVCKGMAATPLNAAKSFITASVLWIPSQSSLQMFNTYLMDIAANRTKNLEYLTWLRYKTAVPVDRIILYCLFVKIRFVYILYCYLYIYLHI